MTEFDTNTPALSVSFGPDQAYHALRGDRFTGLKARVPMKYFDPLNLHPNSELTIIFEPSHKKNSDDGGNTQVWNLGVLQNRQRTFHDDIWEFCTSQSIFAALTLVEMWEAGLAYILAMSLICYILPEKYHIWKTTICLLVIYDKFKYARILARDGMAARLLRRKPFRELYGTAGKFDSAFYNAWWAVKMRR